MKYSLAESLGNIHRSAKYCLKILAHVNYVNNYKMRTNVSRHFSILISLYVYLLMQMTVSLLAKYRANSCICDYAKILEVNSF